MMSNFQTKIESNSFEFFSKIDSLKNIKSSEKVILCKGERYGNWASMVELTGCF